MGRFTLVLQALNSHESCRTCFQKRAGPGKQNVKMPQTEKRRVESTKLARGCCDVREKMTSRRRSECGLNVRHCARSVLKDESTSCACTTPSHGRDIASWIFYSAEQTRQKC